MRVRKMTPKELLITKLVVEAQYQSDYAKDDWYERKIHYAEKARCIRTAIRLLNNTHSSVIRYRVVVGVPDQNGYRSNVFYFEFNLPQGRKQISFHGFERGTREGGHPEIEWTGVVGESLDNAKLLNEAYGFGLDMNLY